MALSAVAALPSMASPRVQVTVQAGRGCDRKAVHGDVDPLRGRLGRCLRADQGQAQVRIRFRADGTRRDVRATGDHPRPVLRCLERRLAYWTSTQTKGARTCEVTLVVQRTSADHERPVDGDAGTERPHAEQQQELGKPE